MDALLGDGATQPFPCAWYERGVREFGKWVGRQVAVALFVSLLRQRCGTAAVLETLIGYSFFFCSPLLQILEPRMRLIPLQPL